MTPPIRFCLKSFSELSAHETYGMLALRSAVFVVEQNCVFLDPDNADFTSWHLLGQDEGGQVLAYLRLIPAGVKYVEASIGRVVTASSVRRTGAGRALLAEGLRQAQRLFPGEAVRIGAQQRLERFYEEFGFVTASPMYMEDGIAHVEMIRAPQGSGSSQSLIEGER